MWGSKIIITKCLWPQSDLPHLYSCFIQVVENFRHADQRLGEASVAGFSSSPEKVTVNGQSSSEPPLILVDKLAALLQEFSMWPLPISDVPDPTADFLHNYLQPGTIQAAILGQLASQIPTAMEALTDANLYQALMEDAKLCERMQLSDIKHLVPVDQDDFYEEQEGEEFEEATPNQSQKQSNQPEQLRQYPANSQRFHVLDIPGIQDDKTFKQRRALLNQARVVFCTVAVAGRSAMQFITDDLRDNFDIAIIDEAAQLCEASTSIILQVQVIRYYVALGWGFNL